MRPRRCRLVAWATLTCSTALSLGSIPSPTWADDRPANPAEGRKLLSQGDKLADDGKPNDAVVRYKEAFEQLLPGLRHLPFHDVVKRDVTAREELKNVLIKELDEDQTPQEFRTGELAFKAFGLIPRDLDWKGAIVRVYSEEIAAFYDPKTKTMHLIKESEQAPKPVGFLEAMLGKKPGFDKDGNKTVIAHELTHALADQHYDLDAMQEKVKKNDDQSLALSALIEGEATLAMIGGQMEDWTGDKITEVPASTLDRMFSLMIPFMPMASGPGLREAPPILADSLTFPYLRGLVFVAKLTNAHGWSAVDSAYKQPPQSTEQILHPEKYSQQPDPPTLLDLGKLPVPAGFHEVGQNVLGEFQLSVLLRRHGGKGIAAGWDGDRYAVFEGPDGKLGLAWLTTWDTDDDARDFARQYTRYQTTKLGEGAESPATFPDSIRRPLGTTVLAVERRGRDVAVVEGFEAKDTEALVAALLSATRTEMAPIRP